MPGESARRDTGRPTIIPADRHPPTRPDAPGPLPTNARRALQFTQAFTVVYLVLDLVAQLLPPHYSAISQAESDLAVGPFGYVMTVNFIVRGLLSLSFLFGLLAATTVGRRSTMGIALVGIWALGAFVLAAFPTDVGAGMSLHGLVHLATAALAFLAAAVGEVLLSLRFRGEPRLDGFRSPALLVSASGVLALVALLYVEQKARLFTEAFGLFERIFIGLVLLWMFLIAAYLLGSDRLARAASASG